MRSRGWLCACCWALLGIGVSGCAEERPPINRVQADALNKSFFVGEALDDPSDDPEFYWRNYVVDGRYVGLLDAARQIGEQLGYGPLGGPEDD